MTRLVARQINVHAHTIRCARGPFACFFTPQKSLLVLPPTNMATRRLAASVTNNKVWYAHSEVRVLYDVFTSKAAVGGRCTFGWSAGRLTSSRRWCRPGP